MSELADIGLVGLGVMGANLARNMADRGHRVAVMDHDPARVAALEGPAFVPCSTPEALRAAIRPPCPILLLVPAGAATDAAIAAQRPYLKHGDILVDAGNANFHDTRRRGKELAPTGIAFLGLGVSGGAEGARHGPAIMAGGPHDVWDRVAPILTSIAARHGDIPCADWLGPDGAGHFVKTIHNGIEYADMQLIAEVYGLLRDGQGMAAAQIARTFAGWADGPLRSYLIDCATSVAAACDPETGMPMLDVIADRAGQKGTGRWSVIEAAHLGAIVPGIEAAVTARNISGDPVARQGPVGAAPAAMKVEIADLHDALLFGKLMAYAQGIDALARASRAFEWSLDLGRVARVWRAGCIIRADLLEDLAGALDLDEPLIGTPLYTRRLSATEAAARRVCATALTAGLPVPALTAMLGHYDQVRQPRGTANMIQGLRDFFGQHGFERIDRPGSTHHGPWV